MARRAAVAARTACAVRCSGRVPAGVAANAFLVLRSSICGFERPRSFVAPGDDVDDTEVAQEALAAIPPRAHPALTRLGEESATEPLDDDAAFELGLGLISDGLQGLSSEPDPYGTSLTPSPPRGVRATPSPTQAPPYGHQESRGG
jgi:hypothetical protein